MSTSSAHQIQIEADFPEKLGFLLGERARYKVAHGGRGGAKSWGFARALLIRGMESPIRVLCAREFQNSIRDSVHRLLKAQIANMGFDAYYDAQERVIRGWNGTEIGFEGIRQNVTRIKSYEAVDIVWVEEAQSVSANSWDVLIPTIRRPDSEIWISLNPEFEDDPTYERFVLDPPRNSIVVQIGWRDNPWFPAVLNEEREDLKRRDPDAYDHVWEGRCRRWLAGAIYAYELRAAYDGGRVCDVPHDPSVPVFTAWDLGHTDDTSIWWYQMVGGEVHVLESYSASGMSLSHYATQITGRETTIDIVGGEIKVTIGEDVPELEHRRAYRYETHWLPHDAKARQLAAGGKSTEQQLRAVLGWGNVREAPNLKVEDGIQAARTVFARCWFDLERAVDGLKALRRYRREAQADEVSLKRSPVHDWASHLADAFRYLAIVCQSPRANVPAPEPPRDAWGRPAQDRGDWMTA